MYSPRLKKCVSPAEFVAAFTKADHDNWKQFEREFYSPVGKDFNDALRGAA